MFLDTWAWIEYFKGTRKGQRVRELMDAEAVLYTSPMVLAEVQSKFTRTAGPEDAERRVRYIQAQSAVVEHTAELGIAAGALHAQLKATVPGFGMADAFVLAAARSRGVRVVTGDPHFGGLPDAVLL